MIFHVKIHCVCFFNFNGKFESNPFRKIYGIRVLARTGVALASRTGNLSTSEIITPTTPTSTSHNRMGRAPTPHLISGLACSHGMVPGKNNGGLVGLLGPPPKEERGRKKIKAENGSSLLVVPYPILASGNNQSCATISPKEGKTYRYGRRCFFIQL